MLTNFVNNIRSKFNNNMVEEEDPSLSNNRGSLSFFDEDSQEERDHGASLATTPADDIRVSVENCEKEGNDYKYSIQVV